jgi:ATP-dependent Clp protease protease subunit
MGRSAIQPKNDVMMDQPQIALQQPQERYVYIASDVNEQSISVAIAQILGYASMSNDPIILILSTYGGAIDEMFGLYDVMKYVKCPIITVGIGKVMSAGVLLLAAGVKGKRMIGRSTSVMIHPISSGMFGKIFDIINDADELKYKQQLMVDLLLKETQGKFKREELISIMNVQKDHYIHAEDAVRLGLADQIIGDTKDVPAKKNVVTKRR